jgi:hypothetical protein
MPAPKPACERHARSCARGFGAQALTTRRGASPSLAASAAITTAPPSSTNGAGVSSANSTTSAKALKPVRENVISKLRASSRCRVTTPAMLYISVTPIIASTSGR